MIQLLNTGQKKGGVFHGRNTPITLATSFFPAYDLLITSLLALTIIGVPAGH
jgi:hypothetical protein